MLPQEVYDWNDDQRTYCSAHNPAHHGAAIRRITTGPQSRTPAHIFMSLLVPSLEFNPIEIRAVLADHVPMGVVEVREPPHVMTQAPSPPRVDDPPASRQTKPPMFRTAVWESHALIQSLTPFLFGGAIYWAAESAQG